MSEYSEGICEDGAAILKDGQRMTITEILEELRANQWSAEKPTKPGFYVTKQTEAGPPEGCVIRLFYLDNGDFVARARNGTQINVADMNNMYWLRVW